LRKKKGGQNQIVLPGNLRPHLVMIRKNAGFLQSTGKASADAHPERPHPEERAKHARIHFPEHTQRTLIILMAAPQTALRASTFSYKRERLATWEFSRHLS
jgi:hypothetical protein